MYLERVTVLSPPLKMQINRVHKSIRSREQSSQTVVSNFESIFEES